MYLLATYRHGRGRVEGRGKPLPLPFYIIVEDFSNGNPCASSLREHALTSGLCALAITRPGRYPFGWPRPGESKLR
ncbi:hypothetical protein Mpet_0527 [Methanolacinia petrolearia DSM 11571]|uniref:Uncharacterized protein n=1 Tax=Methanolacinia petrolearia (strain DSM 11571 / OCM 486 / SEBR 4847) TaxID=679926 RepID=E1RHJ2_METP4|nr:hypothetical protein Mpet_0527 [Methanolacinia petrolearia DSM 11571]